MVASIEYDYLIIFLLIYRNSSFISSLFWFHFTVEEQSSIAYDHLRQSYDSS